MRAKTVFVLLTAAIVACALSLLTGCGPSNGNTAHQAVHSAVANPSVQADEQAAAKLVQSCVTSASLTTSKLCIESKVPPAKRAGLETCLVSAATTALGHPGHVRDTFKPLAQTCVAKALAS